MNSPIEGQNVCARTHFLHGRSVGEILFPAEVMLKSLSKFLGRKAIESELSNLTGRFSGADSDGVFLLHLSAINSVQLWEKVLTSEGVALCRQLLEVRRESLTEDNQKGAAFLGPIFTEAQQDSQDELTKFGFWFWRVIFLSMLHPKLEPKAQKLGALISDQSELYAVECQRRLEQAEGDLEFPKENNLTDLYPALYK